MAQEKMRELELITEKQRHDQLMELRKLEFEAPDRREMVRLALGQLSSEPQLDKSGNPFEFDVGMQPLKDWALKTFNHYNESLYSIVDAEAQEYLTTEQSFLRESVWMKLLPRWRQFRDWNGLRVWPQD